MQKFISYSLATTWRTEQWNVQYELGRHKKRFKKFSVQCFKTTEASSRVWERVLERNCLPESCRSYSKLSLRMDHVYQSPRVWTISTRYLRFGDFHRNTTYSIVCGKIVGVSVHSPDALFRQVGSFSFFNYVDGISVFTEMQHIWTFAVDHDHSGLGFCPCSGRTDVPIPNFLGSSYFCDTSDASNTQLWDGMGCSAATCCDFNDPPWFRAILSKSFESDIDVCICTDEPFSNERIYLEAIQLYVQ